MCKFSCIKSYINHLTQSAQRNKETVKLLSRCEGKLLSRFDCIKNIYAQISNHRQIEVFMKDKENTRFYTISQECKENSVPYKICFTSFKIKKQIFLTLSFFFVI